MTKTAKNFLFDLLSTPSPTGWESPGQIKWMEYAGKYAESVNCDAYGNAWATIKGTGKTPTSVMLEAHADEIGFIVKYVTSDGFLCIDRVGGSDHATARGRKVTIYGDKEPVTGLIGNTAIHIRDRSKGEKAPEIHELYVDIGVSKAKEVEDMGIRVGHPLVYSDSAESFGKNRVVGRALDNRIGGFIIAQVMQKLSKEKQLAATVHAANCVHEEIGGMGSKMVAHRLKPDVSVVLDVTHATDTPGISPERHGAVELGGGPTLTHGAANHRAVVKQLMEVAEAEKIPIQHEAASRYTGTDADSIYHVGEGIPTALVSLPLRYMHSVIEVADLSDVDKVVNLLAGFVKSIAKNQKFEMPM